MRLAASFKFKLRATADGRPSPQGTQQVKVVASSNSMLAAFTPSTAEKAFADGLQQLVSRAGAPAVDQASLQTLKAMGFDAQRATCALAACDDAVERSIQWLADHERQPTAALMQQAAAIAQPAAAPSHIESQGAPEPAARQLLAMGYSREAAAAAYAATQSGSIDRCVDWLINNPQSGDAHGASAQPQGSRGRYPDVNFAAQPALPGALHSHAVSGVDGSLDEHLYGAHTRGYSGESSLDPVAQQAAGATAKQPRYHGMGALIHKKQEEAQQMGQEVHSGFKDLEVWYRALALHALRCSSASGCLCQIYIGRHVCARVKHR